MKAGTKGVTIIHRGTRISMVVPEWAQYVAQNAKGEWWAYETEPKEGFSSWRAKEGLSGLNERAKQVATEGWHLSVQYIGGKGLVAAI